MSAAQTTVHPFPERRLGPYRMLRSLGRGGMGEVHLAEDPRLHRRVAIKILPPQTAAEPERLERFRREALALAALNHPNIVTIHSVEEHEGVHFLTMEYVEGATLREHVPPSGLSLDAFFDVAVPLADAVAAAHERGVTHRDLKPDNVMITADGRVKVLDFGIAKLAERRSESDGDVAPGELTREGAVIGTVAAMSPEQLAGKKVDPRSDVFALGVLLYRMASGERPFQGETTGELAVAVIRDRPAPLSEVRGHLPRRLDEIVGRCLEKEPERRYESAAPLCRDLEELRRELTEEEILKRHGSGLHEAPGAPSRPLTTLSRPTSGTASRAVIKTLLLTDLVDSTGLAGRLGDRRAMEIGSRHDNLARELVERHDGLEIDKADGFLVLFERPADAVAFALDYHRALALLSGESGTRLEARVGIHLGEIFLRRNPPQKVVRGAKPIEIEGLAKSVAARLTALAVGRQTLLSRSAFDLMRRALADGELDERGFRWLHHGPYEVQGVDEPIEVFEVGVDETAPFLPPPDSEKARRTVTGASPTRGPAVLGRRPWVAAVVVLALVAALVFSLFWRARREPAPPPAQVDETVDLAVLRFRNLSADPELDWLRSGLPEMLVTDLSQSPKIRVLSSERLAEILPDLEVLEDAPVPPELIHRLTEETGVEAVLRGAYARADGVLRIDFKIEDAQTGALWQSNRVEGHGVSSLFALADALAAAVRAGFEVAVTGGAETPPIDTVTTASLEAWRFYSEAVRLHGQSKFQESLPLLERAVEIDPEFALALTTLAKVHENLGHAGLAREFGRRAFELAERLPLDRRYEIEGNYFAERWSTYPQAIAVFREALDLYPYKSLLRHSLAQLYIYHERYAEAARELETIIAGGESFGPTFFATAHVYAAQGHFTTGGDLLLAYVRRHPDDWFGHVALGWHLTHEGRFDEAARAIERAAELRPGEFFVQNAAWRLAVAREEWAEAARLADEMSRLSGAHPRWRGAVSAARLELYHGRSRAALDRLEEAAAAYSRGGVSPPETFTALSRSWAAEVLLARGEHEKALAEARRAAVEGRDEWPELRGLFLAGRVLASLGRQEEAARILAELEARAERGDGESGDGESGDGESGDKVVEQRQALHLAGLLALERGDAAAARQSLYRAEALLPPRGLPFHWHVLPDHVPIYYDLGRAELAAGRYEAARQWFRRVIESGVEHLEHPVPFVRSSYYMGRIHHELGDAAGARPHFARFVELWGEGDLDREWVAEARRLAGN